MSTLPVPPVEPQLPSPPRPSEIQRVAHARHQLCTPLNAILGYSEMLLDDCENTGQNDAAATLHEIIRSGNGILDSINLLTNRSKSERQTDRRTIRDRAFSEIHAAREHIEQSVKRLRAREGIMDLFGGDVEAIESACVKLHEQTHNEEARLWTIEQRMSSTPLSIPGAAVPEQKS